MTCHWLRTNSPIKTEYVLKLYLLLLSITFKNWTEYNWSWQWKERQTEGELLRRPSSVRVSKHLFQKGRSPTFEIKKILNNDVLSIFLMKFAKCWCSVRFVDNGSTADFIENTSTFVERFIQLHLGFELTNCFSLL